MKNAEVKLIGWAITGIVALCGYLVYKDKKLRKYKDETMDKLTDARAMDVSLGSPVLEVDDRVKAKKVLDYYRESADNAPTLDSFKKRYNKYLDMIANLEAMLDDTRAEEAQSLVRYEHDKLLKMEEEKATREARNAELEKIRTIGSTLGSIIPDVKVAPIIKNTVERIAKNE